MSEILIAERPKGWNLYRLGQVFEEKKQKASDKDFQALSVTMQGIVPQLETAAKTDDGDNRKLVRNGNYVINSRSDRKGSGGISPLDGTVSLISIVLQPRNDIDPSFAHHLLRSVAFQEEFYRMGHGIVADLWTTRFAEMKNIRFYLPDLPTQKRIADFLDRETSRIDQLIERKMKLNEVLKEKRSTMIKTEIASASRRHEADGHGSARLKHFVTLNYGDALSSDLRNDGPVQVFGSNGVVGSHDASNALGPCIIVGRKGSHGKVNWSSNEAFCIDTAYYVDQRHCAGDLRYCFYLLTSLDLEQNTQDTGVPGLARSEAYSRKICMPSIEVQRTIASNLDWKVAKIDELSRRMNVSIDGLKEYRSSLITAAVTGQIDLNSSQQLETA